MQLTLPLALVLAAIAGVAASDAAATPVQKVIDLLNGMMANGKAEKHDEMVAFAAYKTFCDDTAVSKSAAIKEANEKIDLLKSDIAKYAVDAEELGREIAALEEDIAVWSGDENAATKVREIEQADYDLAHKDYSESIDALGRAIDVLKSQAYNRKQASFSQVSSLTELSLIPKEAKRAIEAFLSQDPDSGIAVSAPEANGYDFRSHAIIETLEKLMDKFISERTGLEKDAMNSKHSSDMLMQELASSIAEATADRDEKAETKAKKLQAKADAEGDLTDTTTTRDADDKYLKDLVATCETKATDFEKRQNLRAEELQALGQAIAIISSNAVSGNADTYLPTLLQKKAKGASLASLRALTINPAQEKVAKFLQSKGTELGSRVLSMMASRVLADPFGKVKKLIKDLLMRLMEEATDEATHKGWCDTELSTNEQTRKEKTTKVELLHAEIDELEASISSLAEDLSELTEAVAALDAAMADATKLRQEEKAVNTKTIKDAGEAQEAVAQALTVLKEFYAKSAESTALLQQKKRQQPTSPPIFDSAYTGMQAESGGVVSMLEVIMSDFGRLEADTKSAEATAQKEYDTFMEDSKIDKARKTSDIEHKTAKKKGEEQALVVKKADLEGTQKELTAAMAYYDKLKPSCVDSGVSYDDRVSRRKEEIESLQEALRILNGENLA
jgi:uncharacterized protein YoxC